MWKLTLLAFVQLLLLSIQNRFVNRSQYLGMIISGGAISTIYISTFGLLVHYVNEPYVWIYYGTGTVSGSLVGVWLHKKLNYGDHKSDEKEMEETDGTN